MFVLCSLLTWQVKSQLAPACSVHLTTDGGTSAAVKKYQAVTAHFLNQDLQVQEFIVAMVNMKNAANQTNLEKVLDRVIQQFGLDGKDLTIITDNASNITSTTASMTRAGKISEGLRCAAHTLQLAVRDVLEEPQFKPFLDKIRGRLNTMRKSLTARICNIMCIYKHLLHFITCRYIPITITT